jgi:hypothetical protein
MVNVYLTCPFRGTRRCFEGDSSMASLDGISGVAMRRCEARRRRNRGRQRGAWAKDRGECVRDALAASGGESRRGRGGNGGRTRQERKAAQVAAMVGGQEG